MASYDLKLLDCTLRDGGYVNNWKWGFQCAREIIRALVKAHIDIIEVGFLRNVEGYDPDITVCNTIDQLNRLLPKDCGQTMFSAMAMNSNFSVEKLTPYSGSGIELIRITAHEYDIEESMAFARQVMEKGYKLSINPINIMGYSDEKILWILKQVNEIHPCQFSIVDTFGSMKRRDLDRIVSLADNNLEKDIRLALHLHENMSLSCCLAQNFIDRHLGRPVSVDASLMGMGRIPGNLPIELIADYLNDYMDKSYDIDYLMDGIQDYIAPLKGEAEWGYTPAYFLSARFNLHRNYAEYYLEKGDLTNRDINHILARFERDRAAVFDKSYADMLYEEYKNNRIQDYSDREKLEKILQNRDILIIAPGSSIVNYSDKIKGYIGKKNPIVISVNFIPEEYSVDYAFFSNRRRYNKLENIQCRTIVTSNLKEELADYRIDYNSLAGAFEQGCNSLIMLLKLLKQIQVKGVMVAGADGYTMSGKNYYNSNIRNYTKHGNKFNMAVAEAIHRMDIGIEFLTPSAYDME
ncbi:MAG: hypothetical protein HFH89_10025 [Lachnospiraceae bacterium]|nr:aldolase catalytic domain-containing protein [uncultured Acetatifactor sp.]MCI8287973.1 hypothetical protein [Lachnospiraceae bacterium]